MIITRPQNLLRYQGLPVEGKDQGQVWVCLNRSSLCIPLIPLGQSPTRSSRSPSCRQIITATPPKIKKWRSTRKRNQFPPRVRCPSNNFLKSHPSKRWRTPGSRHPTLLSVSILSPTTRDWSQEVNTLLIRVTEGSRLQLSHCIDLLSLAARQAQEKETRSQARLLAWLIWSRGQALLSISITLLLGANHRLESNHCRHVQTRRSHQIHTTTLKNSALEAPSSPKSGLFKQLTKQKQKTTKFLSKTKKFGRKSQSKSKLIQSSSLK